MSIRNRCLNQVPFVFLSAVLLAGVMSPSWAQEDENSESGPAELNKKVSRLQFSPARAVSAGPTGVPSQSNAAAAVPSAQAARSQLAAGLVSSGLRSLQPAVSGIQTSTSEARQGAELRKRLGRDVEIRTSAGQTVRNMRGPKLHRRATEVPVGMSQAEATSRSFLRANHALLGLVRPDAELILGAEESFAGGGSRVRFDQRHLSHEVFGAELAVYLDEDGDVERLMGTYIPSPRRLPREAVVGVDRAVAVARKSIAEVSVSRGGTAGETSGEVMVEPTLMVYAEADLAPALAWKIQIKTSMLEHWLVAVDALSGRVLTQFNQVHNAPGSESRTAADADIPFLSSSASGSSRRTATATGRDMLGRNRTVQVFQDGNTLVQIDVSKSMYDGGNPFDSPQERGAIYTLDLANRSAVDGSGRIDGDRLNNGARLVNSTSSSNWGPPDAVSAGRNMGIVFDYFLQQHGRNSIDDNGVSFFNYVRIGWDGPGGWNNAANIGTTMFFGNGDRWAESLDVVAHEMAHGVTGFTAKLVYQNQSGALNESWSDVFGEAAEAFATGSNDWLVGSALTSGGLRSMRSPNQFNQPDHVDDFVITDSDNGGVHINSGITNRAFYLMVEGLPNSIGMRSSERIFYLALTKYLLRNSTLADSRDACLAAARDLFGQNSAEWRATADAFSQVGIGPSSGTTPDPPKVPAVNGAEATLFSFFSSDTGWILGRREPGQGDPNEGVILAGPIAPVPAHVTGDGSLAFVVSADNDACFVDTRDGTPECLGFSGQIYSVAMSPTGLQYAFVFQDAQGNPGNTIGFIDLGTELTETFSLTLPVPDAGGNGVEPLFASAMTFTGDGRFLFYDALSAVTFQGQNIGLWSLFALDLATGSVAELVSPDPEIQTGFPSLSNTSDIYIAFDAFFAESNETVAVTGNLLTGELTGAVLVDGSVAAPVFTGDDRALIFTSPDANTSTGFVLGRQALAADHVTPVGDPQLFLADGALPSSYRRGRFTAPTQGCVASDTVLCINNNRFAVEVFWETATGDLGPGHSLKLTNDTGYFWFFGPDNVEIVIKALNACPVNGRFWLFAGGLTDVRANVRVTDTLSGSVREFMNPKKTPFLPIQTTSGFNTCSVGSAQDQARTSSMSVALAGDRTSRMDEARAEWPPDLPGLSGLVDATSAMDRTTGATLDLPGRDLLGTGGDEANASAACNAATSLCLGGGRFEVKSTYRTSSGSQGSGIPIALTRDTGYFWFFDQANVEVVVKVLDGCALNDRYWVFAAGLTDVRVGLTVSDTDRNRQASYTNPLNRPFRPIQDTSALATCP